MLNKKLRQALDQLAFDALKYPNYYTHHVKLPHGGLSHTPMYKYWPAIQRHTDYESACNWIKEYLLPLTISNIYLFLPYALFKKLFLEVSAIKNSGERNEHNITKLFFSVLKKLREVHANDAEIVCEDDALEYLVEKIRSMTNFKPLVLFKTIVNKCLANDELFCTDTRLRILKDAHVLYKHVYTHNFLPAFKQKAIKGRMDEFIVNQDTLSKVAEETNKLLPGTDEKGNYKIVKDSFSTNLFMRLLN